MITGGKRVASWWPNALNMGLDIAVLHAFASEADDAARRSGRDRRAAILQADLQVPEACSALVGARGTMGRLDILINMASVYVERPFEQVRAADWKRRARCRLRAAFFCAQAAVPYMRTQGGGRIVNFADWTAKSGRPRYRGLVPYYVAKAGVIALTEALALELAADNILVNAIAPGPILAPISSTDEEIRAVEQATPLGRWGGEIEIAKSVLALLDSNFITGETIRVDGGRHVK